VRATQHLEVDSVNRRRADLGVGLLVAAVLAVGGVLSWQAYQRQQSLAEMGSMMGMSMDTVHGTDPVWYVLGTLLLAAGIVGFYLTVRDDLPAVDAADERPVENPSSPAATPTDSDGGLDEPIDPAEQARPRVLDLLPEDERRVLEPVLTSPGITQIELRDRSDFSKSKVSQTVSALEKRGLLYRERQGRTYRIYPSDDLQET
jgi:DNA-binding transcriptional ArsR family regulator